MMVMIIIIIFHLMTVAPQKTEELPLQTMPACKKRIDHHSQHNEDYDDHNHLNHQDHASLYIFFSLKFETMPAWAFFLSLQFHVCCEFDLNTIYENTSEMDEAPYAISGWIGWNSIQGW